jgi:hypothetical protein
MFQWWLHSDDCPWDSWAYKAAALNVDLEILQWLHNASFPKPAAENGNLGVIQNV